MKSQQLLLEFADVDALTRAARTLRDSGRWQTEWVASTPCDKDEIAVALGPARLTRAALGGALLAGIGGFALQFYMLQPIDSAIRFIPGALEMAALGAALAIAVVFSLSATLPRVHHPSFDVDAVSQGEGDRYFLLVHGEEWQHERVLHLLRANPPLAVREVADALA